MSRHDTRSRSAAPSRTIAPFHRGPQAVSPLTSPTAAPLAHAPNAALLIDFDNVTMGIRSDLQGELNSLLSSDIVKGKVIHVGKDNVVVDIGYKSEGVIPVSELSIRRSINPADEVSVGDDIAALASSDTVATLLHRIFHTHPLGVLLL